MIIERKFYGISTQYSNIISKIIDVEIANLPSGNSLFLYIEPGSDTEALSKEDSDILYFGERTVEWLFAELTFIEKFSSTIQDERFHLLFFFLDATLNKVVVEAVQKTDNESFRRHLTARALRGIIEIYKLNLEKGTINSAHLLRFLWEFYQSPEKFDILPLKDLFVGFYRATGDLSIEYNHPDGIARISSAARLLIAKFPSLAAELVDILIQLSEKIRLNRELDRIQMSEVKRELESIKRQNTGNVVEINRKIDEEIARMEIEPESPDLGF